MINRKSVILGCILNICNNLKLKGVYNLIYVNCCTFNEQSCNLHLIMANLALIFHFSLNQQRNIFLNTCIM
ncbi:hypothetical protein RIF29_09339 [Crotalaria pallida]|uniref:Uncharacterized protein n=1 Tax=Crotalaria pallida TaxID=3830 RepID=A0AAN9FZH4_CROPI